MLWLIPKFITSQTGHGIITIYILPNTSRSKGNQVMKFGQLREYNMTSSFLEKIIQCDRETSSRPFTRPFQEIFNVCVAKCTHKYC